MILTKILVFIQILSLAIGQVNTESMRNQNQDLGINHQLNLAFSYISGSSTFLMFNGNYRLDYLFDNNWHGFIVINHDRAHEKSEKAFNNRAFIHLRALNHFKENIYIERFLQKEYKYFIDLKNRELLGGGLRFNPINELYIGIGAMNEVEKYQYSSKEHVNLKSTNYINHKFEQNEFISIQNVIYFQFESTNLNHYRILWDGNINFKASNKISFNLNLNFRYDMSEINPNGNSYFELTNGLIFYF